MFLNKSLKVELRDGREIVITKDDRRSKTPVRDNARRQSHKPENSGSSKKQEIKSPLANTRGGNVSKRTPEKKMVNDEQGEEYIKTKEYEEDDEVYHVKTSPLKQSARERSSSNNQHRRYTVAGGDRNDRGNYKNHPRRSAFKK